MNQCYQSVDLRQKKDRKNVDVHQNGFQSGSNTGTKTKTRSPPPAKLKARAVVLMMKYQQ